MFPAEDGWGIILCHPVLAAFSRQGFASSLAPMSQGYLWGAAGMGTGSKDGLGDTRMLQRERHFPMGFPIALGVSPAMQGCNLPWHHSRDRSSPPRRVLIRTDTLFANRKTSIPHAAWPFTHLFLLGIRCTCPMTHFWRYQVLSATTDFKDIGGLQHP